MIESGQVVRHDFAFTNTGNQILEILDVRPSCGCTTIPNWNRRIEPGSTGSIPFQFNSEGFTGDVAKTVIVLCNDPLNTNVILQFKGNVWKPVEITPAQAIFTRSSDSTTNEIRMLRIVNNRDEQLLLWSPECLGSVFEAELKTNSPGKEYELRVGLKRSFALTNATATITLKTSAARAPELRIPARLVLHPPVSAMPEKITLPPALLASGFKQSVTVRNQGANVLVLSEAAVTAEGAKAEIRDVQPGRLFMLTVTFPGGFRIPPGQKVEVRVKTNHPLVPEVIIPVIQGHSLAESLKDTSDGELGPSREVKN